MIGIVEIGKGGDAVGAGAGGKRDGAIAPHPGSVSAVR